MLVRNRISNQRGFTLVELMTVVAIIGVLASVGVPQYRKIQRKARRAEATLALGVIASAEAGFYAEYSGYGNNMGGIGAELESAPKNYNVGFLTGGKPGDGIKFCELNVGCGNPNPATFPGYQAAEINSPKAKDDNTGLVTDNKVAITGFQAVITGAGGKFFNLASGLYGGADGTSSGTTDYAAADSLAQADQSYTFCTSEANAVSKGCFFRAIATGNLYGRLGSDVRMDVLSIDQQRVIKQLTDGT